MSRPAISLIQSGLRDLGFDPGPVDGIFGRRTHAATLSWLKAAGAPSAPALAPTTSAQMFQGSARYPVREIVVHCAATRPEWMGDRPLAEQVAEIRRWHVQGNRWRDIGYHWVIGRDGKVLPGRPETEIGAGVLSRNKGVIHICLIGGHGSAMTDRFADHFTPAQDVTLRQLIQGIGMRTRIDRIAGHNEFANMACPGFNVSAWLKEAAA